MSQNAGASEERRVIFASSLGTVFEWYDFYLYGSLSAAIVAATGNIYSGLWYPTVVAAATFVIGMLFVRETRDVDIYAKD